MRYKINSASFTDLKGCTGATYIFNSDKVEISGRNGSGKTTAGIGLVLPLTGKDLLGRANPDIRPDFKDESEPHMVLEGDLDGSPITIEMYQKDTRTKKDREAGNPPKISNRYRINSVDKTAAQFKNDLMDKGIDLNLYERLSSPQYYMNLKEADKRKFTFELAGNITDMDVAETLGDDVSAVKQQLGNYTLEEVESMAKRGKKAASARCDAIPEQIVGLEKSLVDIDVDGLKAKLSELSLKVSAKEEELKNISSVTRDSINLKISEIRNQQKDVAQKANQSRMETIYKCQAAYDDLARQYERQCMLTTGMESDLEKVNDEIRSEQIKKAELDENFRKYKDSKFPESKKVCPTCGQPLPADKIAEANATFEKKKEDYLNGLAHDSTTRESKISFLHGQMQDLTKSLTESRQLEKSLEAKCDKAKKALDDAKAIPEENGVSDPEYKKLEDQIADLNMRLKEADEAESKRVQFTEDIQRLKAEMHEFDRELSKEEVNVRTRNLIAELQAEQKQSAQNLANAEAILYQVALINSKKNEMLSDSVNSKFADFIRFKLFDTLKNGEVRDCCVPQIRNEKGEWKDYTSTANNSLRLKADIAILDGFQKHYDMHIPIVIDNAECLDTENLKSISADTQLFLLVVNDKDLEVKSM